MSEFKFNWKPWKAAFFKAYVAFDMPRDQLLVDNEAINDFSTNLGCYMMDAGCRPCPCWMRSARPC